MQTGTRTIRRLGILPYADMGQAPQADIVQAPYADD